jgi:hypothetical protein
MEKMLLQNQQLDTSARKVKKNGVDFLVVPGVPIREQVLNDYLVPGEEISRFVGAWNGRPVSINHPQTNNGSANSPDTDVPIVGALYNCAWDEAERRLTGEYWLNMSDAAQTESGQAILNAVENGVTLETSTGYYADEEIAAGIFGGKRYEIIHHNLRPDHVAILPADTGACSVADGCGVNRNCAACPGKLRQQNQVNEGGAQPSLSNSIPQKEKDMSKKNGGFAALLVSLGEALGVKVNVEAPKEDEPDTQPQADQVDEGNPAAPVANAQKPCPSADTATPPAPLAQNSGAPAAELADLRAEVVRLNEDIRGYINLMTEFGGPEGFKKMLAAMQEVSATQVTANKQAENKKAALVGQLKANARCTLSDAALNAMSVEDLTALDAALRPVNFAGQGATTLNTEQKDQVAAPVPVLLAKK